MWLDCFQSGGKLLLCGNGGSAADSEHISGELLKGFGQKRPLDSTWKDKLGTEIANNLQGSLPAIPLSSFTALGTAYANDCNPDYTFAQLVFGLGNTQDVLMSISTSGNSKNVVLATEVARKKGLKTVGLTGQTRRQTQRTMRRVYLRSGDRDLQNPRTSLTDLSHAVLDGGSGDLRGELN